MRKLLQILISCGLVVVMGGTASGETYNDGIEAFKQGDWIKGIEIMKPLAEEGDSSLDGLGQVTADCMSAIEDQEKRIAANKVAEQERIAANKAAEQERFAANKVAEQERIAANKAAEQERIAAENLNNRMKGIKPERQKRFLNIVQTHADKYKKAKTEIKKSLYRKKRIGAFRIFFWSDVIDGTPLCFTNWVGTVKSLDTDTDGDAMLGIDIGGFIFLNYGPQTIPMHNSLFNTVAEMEENDKVVLSGCFAKHINVYADNWFLFTHENTENGAMTSPTFQGSYTDIKKSTDTKELNKLLSKIKKLERKAQENEKKMDISVWSPDMYAKLTDGQNKAFLKVKELCHTVSARIARIVKRRAEQERIAAEQRKRYIPPPRAVPNIVDTGALKNYIGQVRSIVLQAKIYPEASRRAGRQGIVRVQFTILRSGEVDNIKLLTGTPYPNLNQAAMAAVKRAAPFPGFPDSIMRQSIKVVLPFRFELN